MPGPAPRYGPRRRIIPQNITRDRAASARVLGDAIRRYFDRGAYSQTRQRRRAYRLNPHTVKAPRRFRTKRK